MKGFKDSTKTSYSMGGPACYAKGGAVKGAAKVAKVMGEFKSGELHSGSKTGPVVKSPAQAKAIALSEARKAKAPVKKNEGGPIGKMPPIGESVKSGNRVAKQEGDEMRAMKTRFGDKRPSAGASVKSGNRVSAQEAAEARALGVFKDGGKVRKYADGGPVSQPQQFSSMTGAQQMGAMQPMTGPQPMDFGRLPPGVPGFEQQYAPTQANTQQPQQLSSMTGAQQYAQQGNGYGQPTFGQSLGNDQRAMSPAEIARAQQFAPTQANTQQPQQFSSMTGAQQLGAKRPRTGPRPMDFGRLPPGVPGFEQQYAPTQPMDFGRLPPGVPGFEQQYAQRALPSSLSEPARAFRTPPGMMAGRVVPLKNGGLAAMPKKGK